MYVLYVCLYVCIYTVLQYAYEIQSETKEGC